MSDSVVNNGISALGGYGPGWVFALFLLVAAVVILLAIAPSIKNYIDQKALANEAEVKRSDEREQRKAAEFRERSELDGQMVQLLQQSNTVIERNNQVFRQMTNQFDKSNERNQAINATLKDINLSMGDMEKSFTELRIELMSSQNDSRK